MEQMVISTLLKFNDIFDAMQKMFRIHNYNCSENKQKLLKYLDSNYTGDCIYVTLNDSKEMNPFNEEISKLEVKIKQLITDDRVVLDQQQTQLLQIQHDRIIREIENKQISNHQQFSELREFINETYAQKLDVRQLKVLIEERLVKVNEQFDYIQSKYAIKSITDSNIQEMKGQISNILQLQQYVKQDTQLLHKLNNETRSIIHNMNTSYTEQIRALNTETSRIDSFFIQVDMMKNMISEQQEDNHKMKSKVKSISQLFQDLEVNNTKTVKFEIHSEIRKVDDQLQALRYHNQSLQNQISVYKESMERSIQNFQQHKQQTQLFTEKVDNEHLLFLKDIRQMSAQMEGLQKISATQCQQEDIIPRINALGNQISKIIINNNLTMKKQIKVLEVIQEFCETTQLPSDNQEKDLTALILLMDRRIQEYSKQWQSEKKDKECKLKLQTPRLSTSLDSSYRIHSVTRYGGQSQKPKDYSKTFQQTIYKQICNVK